MGLVIFQVLFLAVQIYVFYPRFSGVLALDPSSLQARSADSQSSSVILNQDERHQSEFKYQPNWESLESRPLPSWFDEAKIGIFIHWGVFSVPSFVGVGTKGLAEWFWFYLKDQKPQGRYHTMDAVSTSQEFMKKNFKPGFLYPDFVRDFTAEFYDPDHWADIFEASGAK